MCEFLMRPFTLVTLYLSCDNDIHVDAQQRQHAQDSIVSSEPLRIPFTLEGVIASIDIRSPTLSVFINTGW
jgi:hypothetical protein